MPGIALTVGGSRTHLGAEEAKLIKGRWETEMADDKVVVKVDLSCRQWSVEAIEVLKPLLEKVALTIVVLDIQDTIAGLHTDLGFEIMELFTDIFKGAKQIEEINMNDNATGPRVLARIAPLLGGPKVKKLYFNNCGLSSETIPQLDEAVKLGGSGPGVSRLEALTLNRNMVGAEGAQRVGELLATCVNLTYFSYVGCRPGAEGTKYIAEGLKKLVENNPDKVIPLAKLELVECSFGGTDGEFPILEDLGKALEKMGNLTYLNMYDTGDLGDAGTGIVAQALITSKCKLEVLDMGACSLGTDGAESLAEMLREKLDTIKELKLETNELENDGVEKILAAFNGGNCLERLSLDENDLDDGAIDILLNANLPKLRVLSLKDNTDLEEAEDEKKDELRIKFAIASVLISDDDAEQMAEIAEQKDDAVDALADTFSGL